MLTIDDDECRRVSGTVEMIGKRWTSATLLAIARGATRFSEIRTLVAGVSDRMLAARLRELEHADLVERTVEPTTPVSIHYSLTSRGRDLISAIHPLVQYSRRYDESRTRSGEQEAQHTGR